MGILDSPSFMKSDEQSAHLIDESSVKTNFLAGNSLMLYFHLKSKPTMPLMNLLKYFNFFLIQQEASLAKARQILLELKKELNS